MDPATARDLTILPMDKADPESVWKLQSLIGALVWLSKTRHDIILTAFSTNPRARFTLTATPAHVTLSMRILKLYLKGTIEYEGIFSPILILLTI